ncbi:hypothetical protein [Vibrio coralliilyticus]|uniref:hypothetical protein n=1 Tax=Vibrio coralliilyticus TaxID=190893 RepID=UPI002FD51DBA
MGCAVINERTWFPEDLGTNSEFAPNCYPCHRTVPVWSMAQQSAIAVSNGICSQLPNVQATLQPAPIILLVLTGAS